MTMYFEVNELPDMSILRCEKVRFEQHTIPLGTLVEVDLDYSEQHGIRAFVVEHTRDCDGSPLYAISLNDLAHSRDIKDCFMNQIYRMTVSDGWTADCLKIIREPK